MARLNEPPIAPGPSGETIEAVKRRFLRQNREFAKTNSQQSVRIRNLETEGSRLLAENLSLREQVLQLQNALEAQSNRPSFENINTVKNRLEAKLIEFGSLVAELGQMQKTDTGPRCKSQTAATRRSPDERQWRSGLGLQEVENAMLPTIAEGKSFPRMTMDADELRGILDDPDSQSPDIGPPPISRFDSEEPIAFNPSSSPDESPEGPAEEPEPALSVNLETRRKRRESGPKLDNRRVSIFESPPAGQEESASKTIRAGAKRKFSVQEDEDKADARPEAFRFTRRHTPAIADDTASKDVSPQSPERPVLGSKPVNTDPMVSPKKQRSSTADKSDKKPLATSKSNRGRLTITRNVQPELPPIQVPESVPTTEIHLESLPPKTPAVGDILSPPSTEPSTSRPETKDTPPPGDLSSSDQTGQGARPSRRARPQVSYKEPSLSVKMRRPGKELVDAVPTTHGKRTSTEPPPTIKREPNDANLALNSVPLTTHRGADEDGEAGSPLREKLGRKEGSQNSENGSEPLKLNSSAASNAISALISATGTTKRKTSGSSTSSATNGTGVVSTAKSNESAATAKSSTVKEEENVKDNLAVFDFTDSSPNHPRVDLAKVAKNRRHSSVPASSATEERKSDLKTKSGGTLPSLHSRSGSGAGVKNVSTSSLARSTSSSSTKSTSVKEKKVAALPTSGSNIDLKAVAEASETGSLRAERAASRRKSMML